MFKEEEASSSVKVSYSNTIVCEDEEENQQGFADISKLRRSSLGSVAQRRATFRFAWPFLMGGDRMHE